MIINVKSVLDTGWIDLVLEGNVRLYTEGFSAQVRRVNNTVFFRGRITNITEGSTLVSVVPELFRPRDGYAFRFLCPCNGGLYSTILINPDSGKMFVEFTSDRQYPAERYYSLNNIAYATK